MGQVAKLLGNLESTVAIPPDTWHRQTGLNFTGALFKSPLSSLSLSLSLFAPLGISSELGQPYSFSSFLSSATWE